MNENYLWDKTGEDDEIQQLENLLKDFRQTELSAPKLPRIETPTVNRNTRKTFRYLIAAAACVAFAIVSVGFWLNSNVKRFEPISENKRPNEIFESPQKLENRKAEVFDQIVNTAKPGENVRRAIPAKFVSAKRSETKVEFAKFPVRVSKKPQAIKLTADEKFAYEQLKLALSITGTQLKIVKDKVDGDIGEKKVGSK